MLTYRFSGICRRFMKFVTTSHLHRSIHAMTSISAIFSSGHYFEVWEQEKVTWLDSEYKVDSLIIQGPIHVI